MQYLSKYSPINTVFLQLLALKHDKIYDCFKYASKSNRSFTGPLKRFSTMIHMHFPQMINWDNLILTLIVTKANKQKKNNKKKKEENELENRSKNDIINVNYDERDTAESERQEQQPQMESQLISINYSTFTPLGIVKEKDCIKNVSEKVCAMIEKIENRLNLSMINDTQVDSTGHATVKVTIHKGKRVSNFLWMISRQEDGTWLTNGVR